MALTAEGVALTEANRRRQLAIAARAARVGMVLWNDLDPTNLDGSGIRWLAENVALASAYSAQSARDTSAYIDRYRAAEGIAAAGPVITPTFDAALTAQILLVAGPLRVKNLVGSGMSGSAALARAKNGFGGMLRRQVLMGGRETVDLTTGQDQQAVGWRRVSDGDPCTFCAMLCGRGPVYRSSGTANGSVERASRGGGTGMHFHAHCGCTSEIVYGSWQPNEQEQGFIDAYDRAAKQATAAGEARTQDTVLHRMRANGEFRDSPAIRTQTTRP